MIFVWAGGLVVPESFFWRTQDFVQDWRPWTSSWAIIGRPSGAGVWWLGSVSLAWTEVVVSRSDHLPTLDLAVVGRFSEGRPRRKSWTN